MCHLYQLESAAKAAQQASKEGGNGVRVIDPAADYDEEEDVQMKDNDDNEGCSDTEMEDEDGVKGDGDGDAALESSSQAPPTISSSRTTQSKRRRICPVEVSQSSRMAYSYPRYEFSPFLR